MSNGVPFRIISSGELDRLRLEISQQEKQLSAVEEFVHNIAQNEFEVPFKGGSSTPIATVLNSMKEKVQYIMLAEERRQWTIEGISGFDAITRNNQSNVKDLCDKALYYIVRYLKVNQGGLFVVYGEGEDDIHLELQSCYAYERKKYREKKVYPQEGIVGQVFVEKSPLYMTEVPQNYVFITSGLGKATPSCIFVVPITVNDQVYGVLELASFKEFEAFEKEFIMKMCENFGSTLAFVKKAEQTNMLLEETQRQTKKMSLQEEMMRKHVEELRLTQEAMLNKQKEVESANEKLRRNEEVLKKAYESSKQTETLLKKQNRKLEEQEVLHQKHMEEEKEGKALMLKKQEELELLVRKMENQEMVMKIALKTARQREEKYRSTINEQEKEIKRLKEELDKYHS
ncbi:GAF domain-containing protein [Limibacter armeniacum]|uniref:GAF domain-containing protein n=1 Tax=Limibacter armeniacum TaxID=466084 RepID=UPI002FE552FA